MSDFARYLDERVSHDFYCGLNDAFKLVPVPVLSLAFRHFLPVSVVFRRRRYFAYVDRFLEDSFVCYSFFRIKRDGTIVLVSLK